jgi:hypothetical protein
MEETFSVRSVPGYITRTNSSDQLRAAVLRSEKLVPEAGNSLGTQRKRNVSRWKPLPSNDY